MESMRDVNRVMEREIKKGSSPLKLDHIEFGDYSYQEIMSQEKLFEVLTYLLRIGDFKQYAGKTILNNVYMDLRWKKPVFKRTKTIMERNNIFATIRRYVKKLKPQYNGDVYLETVRCYFDISQENLEKCRYTYKGNETYAFLMSDKYIRALYTHCLVARKAFTVFLFRYPANPVRIHLQVGNGLLCGVGLPVALCRLYHGGDFFLFCAGQLTLHGIFYRAGHGFSFCH